MTVRPTRKPTRKRLAAGVLLACTLSVGVRAAEAVPPGPTEPFWGEHQSGILAAAQHQTYFAVFDLVTNRRDEVIQLLKAWTAAAARMTAGETAQPLESGLRLAVPPAQAGDADGRPDPGAMAADSGESIGQSPSRLTLTFGFGAGLFTRDGRDRYGLAARRPEALVDMPAFTGDQLVAGQTGGDLSVQACAEDPQVTFHAVRQLARIAEGVAQLRWVQAGFLGQFGPRATGRNLMGFLDGTGNPATDDPKLMDTFIWVGREGPAWMRGGSYVVARRSRIAIEHWDRMRVAFQEQTFGREKRSGAPLGQRHEQDPVDLGAVDAAGDPAIPEDAHVRLANRGSNQGMQLLRRSYNYNDGLSVTAERWPPWHQGLEYDAGLLFVCYQRDPRTGFIRMFEPMSKLDKLNQFVTTTASGLFACPGGATPGGYLGQRLFE
jgi:deferrochelatase/peroxidase EfeB